MLRVRTLRRYLAGMILLAFRQESIMVGCPATALREDSIAWKALHWTWLVGMVSQTVAFRVHSGRSPVWRVLKDVTEKRSCSSLSMLKVIPEKFQINQIPYLRIVEWKQRILLHYLRFGRKCPKPYVVDFLDMVLWDNTVLSWCERCDCVPTLLSISCSYFSVNVYPSTKLVG